MLLKHPDGGGETNRDGKNFEPPLLIYSLIDLIVFDEPKYQ